MTETVKLQVTADASKVSPELAKVQKDLGELVRSADGLGDGFRRVGSVAKDVFGALGIAASIGAVTSSIISAGKAAIAFGDQMQKAAARTGIGAGQFAVLADAAKMADIDTASLSKSLQKMQIAISEAGTGSKVSLETFAALGIEFDKFRQLAPEDQFLKLADQINALEDPADRVRAAVQLFGRAGADLLPFFEDGAAGIKKATDEIERLGGKLTDEQIAKLADADDAIKRLERSWSSFARTLTAAVAPALASVLDTLSNSDQAKIDAVRRSQIEALLQSRGSAAEMFPDTVALQKELAMIDYRERQRLLGPGRQATRSPGETVVAPGYAAAAASGSTVGNRAASGNYDPAAARAGAYADPNRTSGRQGGGIVLGDPAGTKAGAAAKVDPLLDPQVAYQSQVYDILGQQYDEYSNSMLGRVDALNSSWLGQVLQAGQTQIDAETFKNQTIGSLMGNLVGMAIQQGGALGKHGKALAIAQTVWAGATAVIETYKNAGGYPFGIAPAAIMAGTVALQLANIKKTNVGSGASSVSSSAGGSGLALPSTSQALPRTVAAAESTESAKRSAVNIYVSGHLMAGQESVRWFAEQLGELINSNDLVFINRDSRQAMELTGL